MNQEYFKVRLSDSLQLGIPLAHMVNVTQLELKNICIVPGVADFWYGVINFQGSLLWVLDSPLFFDLESDRDLSATKLTVIVLQAQIEETQRKVALAVRQLRGIVNVESNKLVSIPKSLSSTIQKVCHASIEDDIVTCLLSTPAFLQQLHQTSKSIAVRSA